MNWNIPMINKGRECPKCGEVYSPSIPSCYKCGNERIESGRNSSKASRRNKKRP